MAPYYCERCPVDSHVATIYCNVESCYLCGICGLNCLRQNHAHQQIVEQPAVQGGQRRQQEQNVVGGPLPTSPVARMNRRLAAILLNLKKTIRRTDPKMKAAAKLRQKYAKGRSARRDDPKDDGASGAAALN